MTDRGRVPFALVGVLLLVGSATYAGSVGTPTATEPRVDERMELFTVEVTATLRGAAYAGAMAAARAPVADPAGTPAGRALGNESVFRNATALRVYTRARRAFAGLDRTRDGLSVSATLPDPRGQEGIERALERTTVKAAGGDGARLRVAIEDVRVTVRRDGRVVGRERVTPTVVVAVPALAVHERVRAYERRLNAGPLEPGLGRRLTRSLYPIAWARGYAQYGGAPVENVIASRHVALAANGAVLDTQRAVFGSSDRVGRRALRHASARAAVSDVLRGSGSAGLKALQRARARERAGTSPLDTARLASRARSTGVSPAEPLTVAVGETADKAFLDTVRNLSALVDDTYTATVTRRVAVEPVGTERVGPDRRPADSWTLVSTARRTDRSVSPLADVAAATGSGSGGSEHPLTRETRRVTEVEHLVRTWETPSGRIDTQTRRVRRYDVSIVLTGRHSRGVAPVAGIEGVHAEAGALDGPNFRGIAERARARLIEDAGGADALASAAVRRADAGTGGSVNSTAIAVAGAQPAGLREWIYDDIERLRGEVAALSVTASKGNVSTFRANPPAELRREVTDRVDALRTRRQQYDGVADRARVAARLAYLRRVEARLRARADARRDRRRAVGRRLPGNSTRVLAGAYAKRADRSRGQAPPVPMSVDATPSYLVTDPVGPATVDSVRTAGSPLVVRNVNLVALPYADAAGPVVDAFFRGGGVSLRTAAQVLRTTRGPAPGTAVESDAVERLERRVRTSVSRLRERLRDRMAAAGVGSPAARRRVVEAGLSGWESPEAKALALANGTAVAAMKRALPEEWPESTPNDRDRLGFGLERAVRGGLADAAVTVDRRLTARVAEHVRGELASKLRRTAEDTTREVAVRVGRRVRARVSDSLGTGAAKALASLPKGVPVAPVPGLWYATVNLWRVEVRGVYASFVVRVPRGGPVTGGFRYVRDGDRVRLDVDGDGDRELLGRASRVGFRTGTHVAVGVPPGPRGVGDVDGNRDETSPGWPDPGWK